VVFRIEGTSVFCECEIFGIFEDSRGIFGARDGIFENSRGIWCRLTAREAEVAVRGRMAANVTPPERVRSSTDCESSDRKIKDRKIAQGALRRFARDACI